MPRVSRNPVTKTPELIAAEQAALKALHAFTRTALGIQADLCRKTGIYPAVMSRMASGKEPITFERAVLLDVATNGELAAEFLCPASAEVLIKFKGMQANLAAR